MRRLLLLLSLSTSLFADTFPLPPRDIDLIGQIEIIRAKKGEDLLDIARRYDLGQNEIRLANPDLDPWFLPERAMVILPKRFILPDAPREGLVLNIPEMRLYYYYYPKDRKVVVTHPVSIGRVNWRTPLGTTRIVAKVKDPVWRPPKSIREEHAEKGDPLPEVVPAGPDNPLGRYALRLGIPGYLIHGTNKPYGIGMRVSHGCVRMYPEDIGQLFPQIPVGTKVYLVNQPIKLGWFGGELYIEVHPPLEEEQRPFEEVLREAISMLRRHGGDPKQIDTAALLQALEEQRGIPVKITRSERLSN